MAEMTEQRIGRVIHSLLPETAFPGQYGTPRSLSDRMTFFHTPGASIAVINNFAVEWARGFGIIDVEANLDASRGHPGGIRVVLG